MIIFWGIVFLFIVFLFLAPASSSNTLPSKNRSNSPPSSVTTNASAASNNGPLDFNAELTKHLTLKRQKQQQQPPTTTNQQQHINATEANLKTNRGPPPQPPSQPPKNLSTVCRLLFLFLYR